MKRILMTMLCPVLVFATGDECAPCNSDSSKKVSEASQTTTPTQKNKKKSSSKQPSKGAEEVTLIKIENNGKSLILSNGQTVFIDEASKKKTKTWSEGDKLGFDNTSKKGSIILYHLASGTKAKAAKEKQKEKSKSKK